MPSASAVPRLLVMLVLAAAWAGAQQAPGSVEVLTLETVLDLARNGPDMRLAEARVAVALAELEAAAAPLSGELRAGLEGGWTSAGANAWSAPFEVSLSLNVLPLGPAHERAARAALALERATAEHRDARARTAISVTRAFLAAVRAEEELALNRRQLNLTRDRLSAMLRRAEAGDATQAEARAAEQAVSSSEAATLTSEHAVAAALANLELLTGRRVRSVSDSVFRPDGMAPDLDQATALAARSDVTAARTRVAEAELDLSAARRGAAPIAAVSVNASHAGQGGELGVGLAFDTAAYQPRIEATVDPIPSPLPGSTRLAIGLDVTLPVGGANTAAVAAAGARLELARGQLDLTLRQAESEVAARRRAVELAELRLEQARLVERASAAAAAELATRRMLGLATLADYQTAELDLGRSRHDVARAEDELVIARLEHAHARGAPLAEGP